MTIFKRLPLLLPFLFLLLALPCAASASPATPGWFASTMADPTNLPPGGGGVLAIHVDNIGDATSSSPVTVVDTLPEGVTATSAIGTLSYGREIEGEPEPGAWVCSGAGTRTVTCTDAGMPSIEPKEAGEQTELVGIGVSVGPSASGSPVNRVTVSGGGAPYPTVDDQPLTLSATPASFGMQNFQQELINEDGTVDTRAGSHPYESISAFTLNEIGVHGTKSKSIAGYDMKDIEVDLPPGIVGNPRATPQCPREVYDKHIELAISPPPCPADTQVGVLRIELSQRGPGGNPPNITLPVFNLVPPAGYAAQFGFAAANRYGLIDVGVQGAANDAVKVFLRDIGQYADVRNVLTFWGVPFAASHNVNRDQGGAEEGTSVTGESKPFLTLPTACPVNATTHLPEPLSIGVKADSWTEPSETFEEHYPVNDLRGVPAGMTGCEHLEFAPSISAEPDTSRADTPAGLTVEVKQPQNGLLNPEGLAGSDIQNTTVTLPAGVAINPGQAAGLQACQISEDGVGVESTIQEPEKGDPHCPSASKVGTDEISTPLLPDTLTGTVYVLQSNPPDLQLLVVAEADGIQVKLVGHATLCENAGQVIAGKTCTAPGQLITTFTGTPELPFTTFKLAFSGGAQAALATPTQCGSYETLADFTPWSSPFELDAFPTSTFAITSGTNGAPCPSSTLPFTPSLIAGSTTDQAAGFTNFSLLLQSPDDQQRIERLQFKAPQGLLGEIAKVQPCTETQAQADACPEGSQIGHTVVASGPGPYPLTIPQPGQPPAPIYLTGPYEGAPFGLLIKVPLVVGPFVLETQVVRAKIEVDPHTAQITVTTNPLPQVVDGIPTDLRKVDAVIDKPGFMLNPTNCNPQSFSGTAWGTPPPGVGGPGSSASLSSPFQMGSCRSLTFKPDFKVKVSGKTSRTNGASLTTSIVYPTTALGANQASSQSNIRSVKVDLPKQLPSRLTTLQKACPEKSFESNPATCPAASRVGRVKVITPLLPVPLEGPAYFVSHGGAKFPELIFVIQGDGVTIYVNGETFISKSGITSDTLRTVPDAPITSFTLTFPQGPFSALGANANLCKVKGGMKMPTAFTAQDGAVIKQSTPIEVQGCPYALQVVRRTVSKRTLTLMIGVPQAGRLTASGRGVSSAAKSAKGRSTVTLTLKELRAGRLRTKVLLRFTPAKGKQRKVLRKSVAVTFG